MDKFLYVAMTGAKETLRAQTANSHNLANASTTGFRADMSAFQSRAVAGSGYASRVYATNGTTGWDSDRRCADVHGPRPGRRDPGRRLHRRAGARWPRGLHARRRPAASIRTVSCSPAPDLRCWATAARSACRRTPRSRSRARRNDLHRAAGPGPGDDGDHRPHQARERPGNEQIDRGEDGLFRMRDGSDLRRRTRTCASPPACSSRAT